MPEKIVENHKVDSFVYSILGESGTLYEENNIPMNYVHGIDARIFPEVIAAMEGAKINETKEIALSPWQGFGEYDANKTITDKIENVPTEFQNIGAEASFENESGEQLIMTVKSIENEEIILDGNHPFAGKTMTFRVTEKDIRDTTAEEIGAGLVTDHTYTAEKLH